MKRIDIFKENQKLLRENKQLKKLAHGWQKKFYAIKQELDEVKAILNRLLNSNTPSSQLPFTERNTNKSPNRAPNGTNPRGKPKGGNGGFRQIPTKFDKKLKVKANKCDKCKGHNLKHIHTEEIPVWDLPAVKLIVTLFYRYVYKCKDCGKIVYGTHPDLPKEGMFGPNLAAFLTELRYNFAGSYEKLSVFLEHLTKERFTAQAIKDCIGRIASKLEPGYDNIKNKLQKEDIANADETKWPVNGDHYYLWLICTLNYVFIAIKNSRARKVITDILGDYFNGVIISDCLGVYQKFAAAFQKCWAHLLRKTYWLKEKHPKSDIKTLHEQLASLFDEAQEYRKAKLKISERIWAGIILNQKLQRISEHKWKSKQAKGIITNWLKEYEGHWLVGVFIPEVELTNNKDERGIRKVIPARKILGGHRTEHGAKDFAIIETHRQTWMLKGKSPYTKMYNFLRKNNEKAIA